MAKTDTAPAAGAEGATPAADGSTPATPDAKPRADRSYIVVPMPADLKARFEDEAKDAKVPVGPYVRNWIAKQLGIELPVITTTRRSKYANDEERKAAQTARNSTRSSTMKALMSEFRKLTQGGMTPEAAAQAAASNVANGTAGTPTPAPAPEGGPVPA